jgi:hypothetical protein
MISGYGCVLVLLLNVECHALVMQLRTSEIVGWAPAGG